MKKAIRLTVVALACAVLLTGCATALFREPTMYTISYCSADKEPVYIEKARFDEYWVMTTGITMGHWKRTSGSIALFPPPPVPKEIYVYWFNYRQQVFYEATVPLKKNAPELMQKLPKHEYGDIRYLTTGVLPDGSAVVWVSNGDWAKDSIWIEVGRAKGRRAEGNPGDYKSQTQEMRERGEI